MPLAFDVVVTTLGSYLSNAEIKPNLSLLILRGSIFIARQNNEILSENSKNPSEYTATETDFFMFVPMFWKNNASYFQSLVIVTTLTDRSMMS